MDFLWISGFPTVGTQPVEPLGGAQGAQAQPQPAADGLLLLWAEALHFASRVAAARPRHDRVTHWGNDYYHLSHNKDINGYGIMVINDD